MMAFELVYFIRRNWFMCCVLLSILLAWIQPQFGCNGGQLKPEITVKYGAVAIIFFISGVSLPTRDIYRSVSHCKLHLFIQCFTLLFVPVFIQMLIFILSELGVSDGLLMGLVTVSCMPPPVSSAIILTKAAGGNEAAAVFNSALGSILGIIITPGLLLVFLGSSAAVPFFTTIFQLFLTILLPLLVGQVFQACKGYYFARRRMQLSTVGSLMLILIIYTTFCDTFSWENSLNISTVFGTIILVVILQVMLLSLVFYLTTQHTTHFSPQDTIAAMFCASHKSLTLGVPMLKILYGNDKRFPLITFPLLIYHPTQILLGGLLVPSLQKWILRTKSRYYKKLYPV